MGSPRPGTPQAARRLLWPLHRLRPPRIRTAFSLSFSLCMPESLSEAPLRHSSVTLRKVEDPRSREKLCGKPGPGGSLLARWRLCCVARQSHSQTLGFWALQGQVDVSGCRPQSLIRKYIPQLFFFFGVKSWAKDTALTNNRPLPSWSPECVKGDSHVTPEV